MRTSPLVQVLHALTEPNSRAKFRDFSGPVWVAREPLNLALSDRRLHEPSQMFACPRIGCSKPPYMYRGALDKHIEKRHRDFNDLPLDVKKKILDHRELRWTIPAGLPWHPTVIAADIPREPVPAPVAAVLKRKTLN